MKDKDFSMKFEQVTYDPSNHLKMLQCFHDCILFLLWTLRLLCILIFRFMVILSLDDAILLLHLRDIEIGNLQLMMLHQCC